MFLFITSDEIGSQTGGGSVTKHELNALKRMGEVIVINPKPQANPFDTEKEIFEKASLINLSDIKLAHFYSGTYPLFVKLLKAKNIKVTYTVAAHDKDESKKEFEMYGMEYNFPHMTNPNLFEKYISSYKNSDLVICPSKHSENYNKKIGCSSTTIIPHGCYEMRSKKLPKTFNVGYLGQVGPDKGVIYLLKAWEKLNYNDAILNLAGSQSPALLNIIRTLKGGNYNVMGYVKNIEDFFDRCSVYVQPSVTEGFGIEVLEAMASKRPVIVSDGAGSADVVDGCGCVFNSRNVHQLATLINNYKNNQNIMTNHGESGFEKSKKYLWSNIEEAYIKVWNEILKK
jgi:glycosyltransferase involved in cell wall biosynthesis